MGDAGGRETGPFELGGFSLECVLFESAMAGRRMKGCIGIRYMVYGIWNRSLEYGCCSYFRFYTARTSLLKCYFFSDASSHAAWYNVCPLMREQQVQLFFFDSGDSLVASSSRTA